ncbi:MAG TPA: anthranilate synthase component I [Chthoniobacterales bacterium]|jgi:anthranilate synthase component 1
MQENRITPSLEKFRSLARDSNLIPLVATFVADVETPISVFAKLRRHGPSFLFESAEKTEESGRFSFIGLQPLLSIESRGRNISVVEDGRDRQFSTDRDPLSELQEIMKRFRFASRPDLPHFVGGAVGYIGYDVVRFFEPSVPIHSKDDLGLPEFVFMIARLIVVFDHRLRSMHVISNAWITDGAVDDAYERAKQSLQWAIECLGPPIDLCAISTTKPSAPARPRSNTTRPEYEAMVSKAKELIAAGDIYQVVLSQRFETDFTGDDLDLYRSLRFGNPSPYMFCLKLAPDFTVLGSSPELHVRVRDGITQIRPIAGTRRRGNSVAEDEKLAEALIADPKERAEHVMLIDLGRNDLGRVAEFGSVKVTEQMVIERYSHVMHIVSHVVAQMRSDTNAFDAVRATFPAGTLSGAPKIRAMQIIADLEKARRGFYGGIVGYFGFDGSHDSCIAIRSIVLKNGRAYLQTGAGIVADSDPALEYDECINKANAMVDAIVRANNVAQVSNLRFQ